VTPTPTVHTYPSGEKNFSKMRALQTGGIFVCVLMENSLKTKLSKNDGITIVVSFP